jgi:putative hydrolase of the HAD superfamily
MVLFNPKNISTLLFDLGGTLIHLSYPFFQTQFRSFGVELKEEEFFNAVASSTVQLNNFVLNANSSTDAGRLPVFFNFLLQQLHAPVDHERYILEVILPEHYRENLWRYVLPGTFELLQFFKEHHRLAMISNSDGRAEALTITYGLHPYFEFVIDSALVGIEKPDRRIFDLAFDRLNVPRTETAYIGDIYAIDVVGSKAAGMHSILLDRTLTNYEDCTVIQSLADLKENFYAKT